MITLQPMNIVQAAADLIFSPVIKKFPDVTVALSEGGIGWIPYFLERIDHTYKAHKAWTFADFGDKLPSQVFMERVILCFIEDDFGARHAREIGTDRICIETDYPHSDAIWPNAPERMMEAFAPTDLTDDEINQITHLNAMKFFRYDPFSIRPREKCTVGALRAEAAGHDVSIVAKGRRDRARRADDARRVQPRRRDAPTTSGTTGSSGTPTPTTYQAAHGDDAARARRSRGARTASRSRAAGARRRRAARDVLELGCGAAQWSIALDAARRTRRRPRPLARAAACTRATRDRRCRSCSRAASNCRSPTRAFDVVFCDHGAISFCDPDVIIPEVAACCAPGGLLAFCIAHPLLYLTWDQQKEKQTRRLQLDYDELGRMELDEGTIDWALPPGEWIRRAARATASRSRTSSSCAAGRRDDDVRRASRRRSGRAAGPPSGSGKPAG